MTKEISSPVYAGIPIPYPPDLVHPSQTLIRILCIIPGSRDDAITASMFQTSLFKPPQFTALSYCWGDDTARKNVVVNGHDMAITKNLHSALRHLRKPTAPTYIWADAICIDQNNVLEKNYQVQEMSKIYAAADEVVAWLGPGTAESDAAFNDIIYYTDTKRIPDHLIRSPSPGVRDFCSRSYWTRTWVVQELASALRSRRKCIVQCGARSIPLKTVQLFFSILRSKIHYVDTDVMVRPQSVLSLSTSSLHKPFLDILWESAALSSSDVRDCIYGIRGISPKFYRDIIQVDYALEFHQLCSKVMAYVINKEQSLDVLCTFHQLVTSQEPSHHGQSPSWVCNLAKRASGMSPSLYSSAGGRKPVAKIANGILRAKGVIISKVHQVQKPYEPEEAHSDPSHETNNTNLGDIEDFVYPLFNAFRNDASAEHLHQRFMAMVAGDKEHLVDRSSLSQCSLTCYELWQARKEFESTNQRSIYKEAFKYQDRFLFVFERLIGRCVFTTFNGHVGIGPKDIRKDDVVCVLYGSRLCVVLRKIGRFYSFVGPAYVDGAMSGEYVRGGRKEVQFWIR